MKRKQIRLTLPILFSLILPATAFFPPAGWAEDTPTAVAESTAGSDEYQLDKITVTARKREENVQKVPVSISVIDDVDIEDKKIESVYDVADFSPSLVIPNNGASGTNTPFMRGIGNDHGYNVPAGLYIDGVPKLSTFGYDEAFLDIERIEVLRGPQGTLYGKNNEAGVINIITRQPDNEWRTKLSVEAGEDSKQQAAAIISGPIREDRFFLGVTALYYRKDGFMENAVTGETVDDREHIFLKGNLRFTPTEKLDISLIASRMDYNDGAMRQNLTEVGADSYGLTAPRDREVASNLDGANESVSDTQALKIVYDIDASLALTSVTARSEYDSRYTNDMDYSSLTLFHMLDDANYRKISQELRLDSSGKDFKWLVGLYYDKDKDETNYVTESIIPGFAGLTRRDVEGDSYSAFAHASYPVWERISLSAGLRYDREKRDFHDHVTGLRLDGEWDEFSPKIGLEYAVAPDMMVYLSAAKGYRSGGFNPLTSSSDADNSEFKTYDAESLWSYELGEKITLLDNRLVINGCVYYMDISDMQVQEAVSPSETYLTNAAEATGKGVELELTATPYQGLDIHAGFAANIVEYDKFSDSSGDYKGNQNPFSPKYSCNLGIQYRHRSGYYTRADLVGYSKMYLDKANAYARDAYQLVNAKIGYEAAQFDVYVYARNLFDETYDSVGYFGGSYVIYSDPREIGARLVYRF